MGRSSFGCGCGSPCAVGWSLYIIIAFSAVITTIFSIIFERYDQVSADMLMSFRILGPLNF
jgi:hypothetical protein